MLALLTVCAVLCGSACARKVPSGIERGTPKTESPEESKTQTSGEELLPVYAPERIAAASKWDGNQQIRNIRVSGREREKGNALSAEKRRGCCKARGERAALRNLPEYRDYALPRRVFPSGVRHRYAGTSLVGNWRRLGSVARKNLLHGDL